MRAELLGSGSWLFRELDRYTFPVDVLQGGSCLDSANRLQDDLETQVKPQCWVTSVQLVKGPGADLVHAICGVYFPVHYVVKYQPCHGGGDDWFFDGYTGLDSGPLPDDRQIDEP